MSNNYSPKNNSKTLKAFFFAGKGLVWGSLISRNTHVKCSSLLFFVAFFTLLHIDCQRLKSWKLGRIGSKDSNWDSHSSGLAVDMYSCQSKSRAEWLKPCCVIAVDLSPGTSTASFLMLDHSASKVIHQSSRRVSKSGYPNISVHSTKGEFLMSSHGTMGWNGESHFETTPCVSYVIPSGELT